MDQYYEYLQSCIVGEQYIFEANYIYEYRKELIMNEGVMDTLRSIKDAFFDFVDSVIDFIRGIVGKIRGIFQKSNSESTDKKLKNIQKNLDEEVVVNNDTGKIAKGVQSQSTNTLSDNQTTPSSSQSVKPVKEANIDIFKYDRKQFIAINTILPELAIYILEITEVSVKNDPWTKTRGADNKSGYESFVKIINGIVKENCLKYSRETGIKAELSGPPLQMLSIFKKEEGTDSKQQVNIGNAFLILQRMYGESNTKFDQSIKDINKIINTFEKYKKDLGLKFKEIEIKENDKGYKKGTYQIGNVISNMYTNGIKICTECVNILMKSQARYKTKIDTDIKRVEAEIRK